jgi:hypothetical protein
MSQGAIAGEKHAQYQIKPIPHNVSNFPRESEQDVVLATRPFRAHNLRECLGQHHDIDERKRYKI